MSNRAARTARQAKKARQKRIRNIVLAAVAVIAVAVAAVLIIWNNRANDPAETKSAESVPAPSPEESGIYAYITIRDYGSILVKLDPEAAPITVENFTKLAKEGFYTGTTFHRIMKNFMMQGGAGVNGKSAATIKGEFAGNGVQNPLSHTRGAISMARAKDMNSASSQFFIVQQDSTYLDGQYAAFGYVVSGMDVVDKVCNEAKPTDNNGTIPAAQQPVIESVQIIEVP